MKIARNLTTSAKTATGHASHSSAAKHLDFSFDIVSPYSYLAYVRLRDHFLPKYGSNLQITYHPIVFGAILKKWSHLGPGEIPPKRRGMLKDLARAASFANLELGWPKIHPFNSLHALRLVSLPPGDPRQVPLISLFYDAAFGKENMGKYELSLGECSKLIDDGVNAGKLDPSTPREPTQEMKERLRETTERAISNGVFGVPSFAAQGTSGVIWGNDTLSGVIERLMEGKQDPAEEVRWKDWIAKVEPIPGIQRAK